jgi:CheY-like chemotaxis protein
LRIAIADTGRGISQEFLANLFTPFDRLGAEQTGEEGTGLGLALSKHLVEAMGGTIGVQSIVEHGSTFWVELALAEGPVERHERMTGQVAPARLGATAGEAVRTVLYIEDNLSNLKLIKRVLARWPQLKLLEAMQGRLGFDLAWEHRPDLILLDLHLPDITGDEVLRRLRDTPETRHIPVVIISADATKTRVNRLLAAGARAYLTKPLDVKKLLTIMEDALKERVG